MTASGARGAGRVMAKPPCQGSKPWDRPRCKWLKWTETGRSLRKFLEISDMYGVMYSVIVNWCIFWCPFQWFSMWISPIQNEMNHGIYKSVGIQRGDTILLNCNTNAATFQNDWMQQKPSGIPKLVWTWIPSGAAAKFREWKTWNVKIADTSAVVHYTCFGSIEHFWIINWSICRAAESGSMVKVVKFTNHFGIPGSIGDVGHLSLNDFPLDVTEKAPHGLLHNVFLDVTTNSLMHREVHLSEPVVLVNDEYRLQYVTVILAHPKYKSQKVQAGQSTLTILKSSALDKVHNLYH